MSHNKKSLPLAHLLTGFRDGLRAIAPIADRVGVEWCEPASYDEWDAIAGGLFEGIVLAAIRVSDCYAGCHPLISYDRRVSDYSQFSFLAVEHEPKKYFPFVCLETSSAPFDTCLLADVTSDWRVMHEVRLPFDQARFLAVCRDHAGGAIMHDTLTFS